MIGIKDRVLRLNFVLGTCVASMLVVAVGSPENPWFWGLFRDVLGIPWTDTELASEVVGVFGLLLISTAFLGVGGRGKGEKKMENSCEVPFGKKAFGKIDVDDGDISTTAGSSPTNSPASTLGIEPEADSAEGFDPCFFLESFPPAQPVVGW